MNRVLYLVEFPPGVTVAGDLLGTTWPVCRTPEASVLHLPTMPADLGESFGGNLRAPSVDRVDPAYAVNFERARTLSSGVRCPGV